MLVKELEYASELFKEQLQSMHKEVRVVKEVVVEDMSMPEIPEKWSQGQAVEWACSESAGEWAPVVDESWSSQEIDVAEIVWAFEKLNIAEDDEGYGSE